MDGYRFAEWARNQPLLAHCPILCLTGMFHALDPNRARSCGFMTVIPKPITVETFVLQVESHLPPDKRMVLRAGRREAEPGAE